MPTSPHLRPMTPDSLRPRPIPQAAPSPSPAPLWQDAPEPVGTLLQPASFPQEAAEEEPLFPDFFLSDADEEDDDDQPDAVPTESMPIPACVPLFDLTDFSARGRKRKKG